MTRFALGLRTRIVAGSVLVAALLSVAAGLVLAADVDRIVGEGTAAVLRSDVAPYVGALTEDPGEPLDTPGPGQRVAVVAPDGVARLDTLPAGALAAAPPSGTTSVVRTSEGDFVVASTTVETTAGTWAVVAARDASEQRTVIDQIHLVIAIGVAVISAGVALGSGVLVTAALRPVGRLREAASRLAREPSDELLPVGPERDELADLARVLNELIADVRATAERERHLIADASHELRTPVSVLRARLELAETDRLADAHELRAEIGAARRDVERLTRLLDRVLELSTIEAGVVEGTTGWDQLLAEIDDAVGRLAFRRELGDHAVSVIVLARPPATDATVALRPDDLARILDNLLTNSARAAPGDAGLAVEVSAGSRGVRLEVADRAGGMSADFADRALDRFTRERSAGEGSGLGLSIVAALVAQAAGTLRLDNRPGDGLTVIINLPFAGSA